MTISEFPLEGSILGVEQLASAKHQRIKAVLLKNREMKTLMGTVPSAFRTKSLRDHARF